MATAAEWVQGARPRTLPAAVAPVLAGTGVALWEGGEVWWKAGFAMLVSLFLQIGVNYANDYSDGVRGTDDDRVGPMRLVGSGRAKPEAVKAAAFGCFGVAGVFGLALAVDTSWWLVAIGAVCILAAWYYTGGTKPYGYLGLGEVMVFVFFGLVAVLGTVYVQLQELPAYSWWPAIGIGALACAILVANNLRDIPTDTVAGKRTLAVRLGDQQTRTLYLLLVAIALAALLGLYPATSGWVVLAAALALVPMARAWQVVARDRAVGPDLVPVLQLTGVAELLYALGLFAGFVIGR